MLGAAPFVRAVRWLPLVLVLAGCAGIDPCQGAKSFTVVELFFGRDGVSDAA
jgi:hypothetical protein